MTQAIKKVAVWGGGALAKSSSPPTTLISSVKFSRAEGQTGMQMDLQHLQAVTIGATP